MSSDRKPPMTCHDIASEHGLTVRQVRSRARSLGVGRLCGRELRFTRAEASRIARLQPKRGRPIKHGLYVGWRDPERRRKIVRRMTRIERSQKSG